LDITKLIPALSFLYNIAIGAYGAAIGAAGAFNNKARLFKEGRKGLLEKLASRIDHTHPIIWFHCSSVGEFEQARPLIEWYKENRKEYRILLTFFSPSGYEMRKNYPLADWICYMPLDTASNARKFLDIVKPQKAIFIKKEKTLFFKAFFLTFAYKKDIIKGNNYLFYIFARANVYIFR
jgi:3-deoxy-D-manno-octulosonic-acid transferase